MGFGLPQMVMSSTDFVEVEVNGNEASNGLNSQLVAGCL